MARKTVRLTSMAKPQTWIIIATVLAAICCGCTIGNLPVPTSDIGSGSSSAAETLYGPDPVCFTEGIELATECNERGYWPFCEVRDLVRDGHVPCYWRDPATGWLWWDNGVNPSKH